MIRYGAGSSEPAHRAFFDAESASGPVLEFHDFATRRSTVIRQFSKPTQIGFTSADTSITVFPGGKWILYTQIDQASSNLMLVDNYR
jgi:hypothetical protein